MRFVIKAGLPARVSAVQFLDDSGFPPAQLMKISGWHPHLILTATRVEHGLYRLRQFYVSHGRLQANINVQQRVYDDKTNTEKLVVKAEGGPLLRVRVQGASISSSQLQNLLPLYHDGVTDDQALAHSEKLLQGYFQQKGYFFAAVKASAHRRQGPQPHIEILFRVNLGRHGDFAGFGVKGNAAIPTDRTAIRHHPARRGIVSSHAHI